MADEDRPIRIECLVQFEALRKAHQKLGENNAVRDTERKHIVGMLTDVHTIVTGNGNPDQGLFARIVKIESDRRIFKVVAAVIGAIGVTVGVVWRLSQ